MRKAQKLSIQPFDASKWRIGIVVSQFNHPITDQLYQSAIQRAEDYSIPSSSIDSVKVAGAIEIPLVLQHLAKRDCYQALLALGCVIRGDTPHFTYVCKFAVEGILRVQLDYNVPIGFGILTCNDEAQAQARAKLGAEFLDAALQQAYCLE